MGGTYNSASRYGQALTRPRIRYRHARSGAVRQHRCKTATSPPSFRFSNVEECGKIIAAAGFEQVTIAEVPQVWRLPSPAAFFDGISASTVRTAALPRAQTAENLARIRAAAEAETQDYSLAGGTVAFACAPRQHTQILKGPRRSAAHHPGARHL